MSKSLSIDSATQQERQNAADLDKMQELIWQRAYLCSKSAGAYTDAMRRTGPKRRKNFWHKVSRARRHYQPQLAA